MQHLDSNSPSTPPSTASAPRKIGVAVDLSDEGANAVIWAVKHYLRQGDTVFLLHVFTFTHNDAPSTANNHHSDEATKMINYFHGYTISKIHEFAEPLRQAQIPYNIHIGIDREMKEHLWSEINSIGLGAIIVGRRGSFSYYCDLHCACPVVVVRFSDETDSEEDVDSTANSVVGNFAAASSVAENSTANSVAEISTANSVLASPKVTYVEEFDEILRQYNEGQLSRGHFKKLCDRVCDQILKEELMENTDEELLMRLLQNERRQQSHTSTRHKRAKHRRT